MCETHNMFVPQAISQPTTLNSGSLLAVVFSDIARQQQPSPVADSCAADGPSATERGANKRLRDDPSQAPPGMAAPPCRVPAAIAPAIGAALPSGAVFPSRPPILKGSPTDPTSSANGNLKAATTTIHARLSPLEAPSVSPGVASTSRSPLSPTGSATGGGPRPAASPTSAGTTTATPRSSSFAVSGASSAQTAAARQPSSTTSFADRILPKILKPLQMREGATLPEAEVLAVSRDIATAVSGHGTSAADIVRRIVSALSDPLNEALRESVRRGDITPVALADMSEHDLANPKDRQEADAIRQERAKGRDVQALQLAMATPSSFFPCPRCKARHANLVELQTASGDEPTTKFLCCLKCNYNWKTR